MPTGISVAITAGMMEDIEAVRTLEELADGLGADEAGMRRFMECIAEHPESATLCAALLAIGARAFVESSELDALMVDTWWRERGGRAS
jgi:hypothetical protein